MANETVIEILFWLGLAISLLLLSRKLRRRLNAQHAELDKGLNSSFEKHRALHDEHAA